MSSFSSSSLRAITAAVALCCSSCVALHEKDADGSSATYFSLGGKAAYRKGVGLVHHHEKSFRDAALAATAVAGSIASTVATKATEETSRVAAQEITKRHAAEQVTQQTTIKAREAVTQTALTHELPVTVTAP